MLPADWMPHRRADGEVVGSVRQVGERFQPMDLFGRPLAEPGDWLAAEEVLDAQGIAWVAEPWLLDVDGMAVRVRVVEVTPARVLVKREDLGDVTTASEQWSVPQPVGESLRPAPPLTEWPG